MRMNLSDMIGLTSTVMPKKPHQLMHLLLVITGTLIFLNHSPIIWYSKAQNTVKTSTFGSEFTAPCIAVELLESLRYKLRIFGVPLEGPVNTFCDNSCVVTNSMQPASTLKKKTNSIAYHTVWEAWQQHPTHWLGAFREKFGRSTYQAFTWHNLTCPL
jgi:hypothetical protein